MSTEARPNILFIISDQHHADAMGWRGRPPAVTPALDRLAREGTAFTRAITPSPVCGPARYCFYSGQYASTNGVLTNEVLPKPFTPLPEYFRRAGYATANIGKLHATPFNERLGFEYCLHHEFFTNNDGISHYDAFLHWACKQRGIEHQGFGPVGSYGRSWLETAETIAFENWVPEDLTPERWTTDQSLDFIRQHRRKNPQQPFFLHASYFPPHHPYAPIKRFLEQIPEDVPLPENFRQRLPRHGEFVDFSDLEFKRMIRYYHAFLLQLDDAIGRLLHGLQETGIADNTLVVYTSDHGDMIGDHGELYKGLMYHGSAGIPLIVRGSGIAAGKQCQTPVSLLDLPPTLLQAAAADIPADFQGRSLWNALQAGEEPEAEPVFSEFFNPYAVGEPRNEFRYTMVLHGSWKLIRNHPRLELPGEELYDLQTDPLECNNRIEDPAAAAVRDNLRTMLNHFEDRQRQSLPATPPARIGSPGFRTSWPADGYQPVVKD